MQKKVLIPLCPASSQCPGERVASNAGDLVGQRQHLHTHTHTHAHTHIQSVNKLHVPLLAVETTYIQLIHELQRYHGFVLGIREYDEISDNY